MKILFVCLGNICRSPMAEGIMKVLVKNNQLDWHIQSAGTESYHIGKPPHHFSQEVCKEHGIDLSRQKAQKFVGKFLDDFDLVYALSTDVLLEIERSTANENRKSEAHLFLNEMHPDENKSVTDPWYGGKEGYYPVFNQIYSCCEHILEKYR